MFDHVHLTAAGAQYRLWNTGGSARHFGRQVWPTAITGIEGVHEPAPTPPDFPHPGKSPTGSWETGACERGTYEMIARHPDEASACVHLSRLLVRRLRHLP
ncbi:hypothetical protein ACFYSH_14435 [Streptomyces sp. NPDC005791]|uniref:hypothetical protein n=1 Tax=Streptomyces sp. NPDC005791 TaxID=3364732 RepID=UPI0036BFCBC4